MKHIVIFLSIISLLLSVKCDNPKIKFGTSLSTQSEETFHIMASKLMMSIYKFFEYWANNEYDIIINGVKYDLEFIIYEDDKSEEMIRDNYLKLINEDNVNLLFGGTSVLSYNIAAEFTEEKTLPLLVFSPDTSIYINRSTVFNVYPNPYSQLYDILPMLRISGARSVHVLDMSTYIGACYNNEEIFKINNIEDVEVTIYDDSDEKLQEAIDKVVELDKDILIYCNMNQTNFNEVARLLNEKQYVPRGAINLMMDKYTMDKNYTDYWMMFHYYVEGIQYPDTKYIGNYNNLKKKMNEYFEIDPTYALDPDEHKSTLMIIYSMVELAFDGVMKSKELNGYNIIDSIRRSKYDSLIGQISYTSDNMHLITGIGYQIINNTVNNIILPHILSNSSIVYPAPTYEERVKTTKVKNIEIAVYVFIGLTVSNSIAWIIYIITNLKNEKLISSSPIFLIGMLVGSIVVSISLIMWSPTLTYKFTCYLLPWLLSIGFTLLFGSLLVKTWRVHVIFSDRSFEVYKISNRKVMFFLLLLLSVDIILLCVWSGISKIKINEIIIDEYRISKNYNTCQSNSGGNIIIWIIVAYKILQIIYGGYLALRIRTIPIKKYDESKVIAFCIYNVGLSAIIIGILKVTNPTGRYVVFGINSFLVLLSIIVTINSMLITKVKYINNIISSSTYSGDKSTELKSAVQSYLDASVDNTTIEENKKLKKNNNTLKKENKNLKEENENLKEENKNLKEEKEKLLNRLKELENPIKEEE